MPCQAVTARKTGISTDWATGEPRALCPWVRPPHSLTNAITITLTKSPSRPLQEAVRLYSDFGYAGSLANPLTDLPYMYGGGDPVNISDWSGHDFSLTDTIASIAINTVLSSAISEAATPFLGYVAAALIPPGVLAALETAGSPDAVEFGVSGTASVRLGPTPFSLGFTGGLELLVSPHNGNAALYGYFGGAASLGSGGRAAAGVAGSAGVVWNSPNSDSYTKGFWTLTLPFIDLPTSLRENLAEKLAVDFASPSLFAMPGIDSPGFLAYAYYNANYAREAAERAAGLVNNTSTSINIFFSIQSPFSFGVSLGLGTQLAGGFSSQVSASWTYYRQLIPSDMPLPFA